MLPGEVGLVVGVVVGEHAGGAGVAGSLAGVMRVVGSLSPGGPLQLSGGVSVRLNCFALPTFTNHRSVPMLCRCTAPYRCTAVRVVNNVVKRNDVKPRFHAATQAEAAAGGGPYPEAFVYKQKVRWVGGWAAE